MLSHLRSNIILSAKTKKPIFIRYKTRFIMSVIEVIHWKYLKPKLAERKRYDYIGIVEAIKAVVDKYDVIEEAYIYGSFARELLKVEVPPSLWYELTSIGRIFREESDIDVFVICKDTRMCREELMIQLEDELSEIAGHWIEWNTGYYIAYPYRIQIKP